jgi:hypothetical protein
LPVAHHPCWLNSRQTQSQGFEMRLVLAHRSDGGEYKFLRPGGYVQIWESGLKVIRNVSLELIPFHLCPYIELG